MFRQLQCYGCKEIYRTEAIIDKCAECGETVFVNLVNTVHNNDMYPVKEKEEDSDGDYGYGV